SVQRLARVSRGLGRGAPSERVRGIDGPPPPVPPHRNRSAPRTSSGAPRLAFGSPSKRLRNGDPLYTGFTEDVSEGGVFVTTYRLAPVGTRVDLELSLPNGHVVRTGAEV